MDSNSTWTTIGKSGGRRQLMILVNAICSGEKKILAVIAKEAKTN